MTKEDAWAKSVIAPSLSKQLEAEIIDTSHQDLSRDIKAKTLHDLISRAYRQSAGLAGTLTELTALLKREKTTI